jgi:hypothetical protein
MFHASASSFGEYTLKASMVLVRRTSGIAAIRSAEPGQIPRILDMALDGLRPR